MSLTLDKEKKHNSNLQVQKLLTARLKITLASIAQLVAS